MWSFNRILNVTRFNRNSVLTLFDIISLYPNREVSDGIIDFVVRYYMCYVLCSTKLKFFFRQLLPHSSKVCVMESALYESIARAVNKSGTEKTEGLLQSLKTVTGGRNLTSKKTILFPRYNL